MSINDSTGDVSKTFNWGVLEKANPVAAPLAGNGIPNCFLVLILATRELLSELLWKLPLLVSIV